MLIGEKPGREEATHRPHPEPFVGISGKYLNLCLEAANIPRSSLFLTNCVREFTEYSKPSRAELERDKPDLIADILACNPKIIGLVGGWAVEWVLDRQKAEMEKIHGVPIRVSELLGGELTGEWVVLPILHPAGAAHSPDSLPLILDDILTLGRLIDGEITVQGPDLYAGQEDYRRQQEPNLIITKIAGVDTEGDRVHPWCTTYSTEPGTAAIVHPPDRAQFGNLVYLHNSLHDLSVLRTMGIELADDQFIDTMVLAYLLCVEPQALKSLAYRHCGAERKSYDEMVSPAQDALSIEYLIKVIERGDQWPLTEPEVVYEGGKPKVYKPQSVLRRAHKILTDYMEEQTGINKRERKEPVDIMARWKQIDLRLRAPVIAALGEMPHADLSHIDYESAMRYACHDASDTLRIGPVLQAKIKAMELEEAARVDHAILPMIDRMQQVGIQLAATDFWDNIGAQCEQQMNHAQWQIFQATGRDINPGSGDQVAALLYGKKEDGGLGLIPPHYTDSGSRGAVDAVSLEAILSQHSVIQHMMDYTEAQKIKGTYVEPLRELCQIGDGRVHSTIRITRTTTGRLSMADPPIHQIPIMTDLGRQIRAGFVAPPGRILASYDFSHLEMRMCAHDSRDELLCKMFWEDRDIHSETACKIFSVPMGNLSVDERGKVNDVRRTVAKHAAFGIINGITEHGLLNYLILNRCKRPDGESWTLDDCVMLLEEWFKIYPGVKRFQNNCIDETRATGLARETIAGRIIYLPQVWSPIKMVRETAERMSYVMHTQGGGQSIVKRSMAEVWRQVCKVLPGVDALFQMHDELVFELPDDEDTKTLLDLNVKHIFENTTKLRVPVKCAGGFGENWLEAH